MNTEGTRNQSKIAAHAIGEGEAGSRRLSYRQEMALLCHCARTALRAEDVEQIRELTQDGIDWAHLNELAEIHRVSPLLFRSLACLDFARVSEETMGRLRERFTRNALRNLLLAAALTEIVSLCEAHGIVAVPFKGPTLAASVYGDLALRDFIDLDILVYPQDLVRAGDLMLALGYEALEPESGQHPLVDNNLWHELKFWRSHGQVLVELHTCLRAHWQLPDSLALDLSKLSPRLKTMRMGGKTLYTLAPEDLLLMLCVHGTCHHWSRLSWIVDVAETVSAEQEIDWEMFLEHARRLGVRRIVYLALRLAEGLLGANLPEKVRQQVQADRSVEQLERQVREWLFRQDQALELSKEAAFFIHSRERWRDRWPYYRIYLRAFLRMILEPTEADTAWISLPPSLNLLYYMLRPVRIIVQRSQGMARKLLSRWRES